MNKITRKFLGVVLSLGLLTTINLATQAKTENKKMKTNLTYFIYKNKDMEKNLNKLPTIKDNSKAKFKCPGQLFNNETSAKEYVNLYAVLQKLFKKYDIPKKELYKNLDILDCYGNKNLKVRGDVYVITEDLEQEKKFENLNKNINKELKNIKITEKEFLDAKEDLIDIFEKMIKEFKKTEKNSDNDFVPTYLSYIKQIKNVKYNDIKNLTKYLEMKNK